MEKLAAAIVRQNFEDGPSAHFCADNDRHLASSFDGCVA